MMFDGNDCLTPSYFMVVAFKIPLSTYLFHSWASYLCSIEILRKAILRDTEFYCILISVVVNFLCIVDGDTEITMACKHCEKFPK